MNEKMLDTSKYFVLTFISFEVIYYIARGTLNIGLVLPVSAVFTIFYAMDKFKVLIGLIPADKSTVSEKTKKDQSL